MVRAVVIDGRCARECAKAPGEIFGSCFFAPRTALRQQTDGQFIGAIISIPNHLEQLVVEAELSFPGLPLDIMHAYWKNSAHPALEFTAHRHREIAALFTFIASGNFGKA